MFTPVSPTVIAFPSKNAVVDVPFLTPILPVPFADILLFSTKTLLALLISIDAEPLPSSLMRLLPEL